MTWNTYFMPRVSSMNLLIFGNVQRQRTLVDKPRDFIPHAALGSRTFAVRP